MVKMLDILEAFLDYRQLTYVRVDESLTPDERQVQSPPLKIYQLHRSVIALLYKGFNDLSVRYSVSIKHVNQKS